LGFDGSGTIEFGLNDATGRIQEPVPTNTIIFPSQDYNSDTFLEMFNALVKNMNVSGTTNMGTANQADSAAIQKTLRLGEEEGTGKYFFYTKAYTVNPGEDVVDNYANTPNILECRKFRILPETTAFYPLGLGYLQESVDSVDDTVGGSYNDFPTVVDSVISTKTYQSVFRCPNRFDLVVSDIVRLECEDLDSDLNRGKSAKSVMPLGEFFLSSPGMNESTFQKDIPDRPMVPRTLNNLQFKFTRDSLSTDKEDEEGGGEKVEYNFRGVRWFIKLAVKTLEIPNVMQGFYKNKETKPTEVKLSNSKVAVQTLNKGVSSMQTSNIPSYPTWDQIQ